MKRIHILLLSAAIVLGLNASAQSFRSGYFLDNYVYGYRINPAQVNDRGFLGLAIGNIDLQNNSNIGISSLLFPVENGLVTGLNKAVSAEKFLGGLKNNNFMSFDETVNLLAIGISNGNTMHTIELNARALLGFNLPKSLFTMAKKGGTGTFDIGDMYADASLLGDVSYGFSTHINKYFTIGARVHFLIGAVNANVSTAKSTLSLSENEIGISPSIELKASGIASGIIGSMISAEDEFDIRNLSIVSAIGGYGAALDLGFEYKSDFGLEAMLSVTDFGAISWSNGYSASASGNYTYSGGTIGFEGNTITTDLEDIGDAISNSVHFTSGPAERSMSILPFNAAAGLRYHMPFYNGLSVGALATYHSAKYFSWYDARGGITFTPARIISLSGNAGYSSFGPVWGAGIDIHLGFLNLLAGIDSFIGKLGKIATVPVPVGSFVENAHVGISITF